MPDCKLPVVLLVALAMTGGVRADEDDADGPRLPVIGRPEFFDEEDGPIGAFQTPTVRASPTDVQVEDPITLTIRVQAIGKVQRPPKQIRLEKFPEIAGQFYVEYPEDPTFQRVDDRTWESTCTLKPRKTNVVAIPSFPFAFFTPGLLPPERGYQIHRTERVAITVRPRSEVQPADVARGVELLSLPESVFQIEQGTSVLDYAKPYSLTARIFFAGLFLLLTAGGLFWSFIWPRFSPESRSQTIARRSLAGKKALGKLDRLPAEREHTQAAAATVAMYLRDRFELSAEEPAPNDVERLLATMGFDEATCTLAGDFFRVCDADQYGHVRPQQNPAALARQVILTLEAGPCPVSVSS
jgi:hypothetical protein